MFVNSGGLRVNSGRISSTHLLPLPSRERVGVRGRRGHRMNNRLQYSWCILQNVYIPESQDSIPLTFEPCVSFLILFGVCMLTTIYLNDESFFVTHEVSYISTDQYLTSELQTYELSITNIPPQFPFGRGRTTSQIFCESCQLSLWHLHQYSSLSHAPSPQPSPTEGRGRALCQHCAKPHLASPDSRGGNWQY